MILQKKICMLGSFAVGKTSLVSRYVKSIFSDKYHTTIGVKIDKKTVSLDDKKINMVIWDLAGDDDFQPLNTSYLRGAAGYLLVVDGTRISTLHQALETREKAISTIGEIPFILLLNKSDLKSSWEIRETDIQSLVENGWSVIETSAKDGSSVEEAFTQLAQKTCSS